MLAWLADAIRIVNTKEASIGINTSFSSSTGMSHLGTLVNIDTALRSSMVAGCESSTFLLVTVALVSRSANTIVFT